MPQDAPGLTAVGGCNVVEHLRCVHLTATETAADGLDGKWTRHWGRMSYIGKACERKYGRPMAVVFESIFAVLHYAAIGVVNGAYALAGSTKP